MSSASDIYGNVLVSCLNHVINGGAFTELGRGKAGLFSGHTKLEMLVRYLSEDMEQRSELCAELRPFRWHQHADDTDSRVRTKGPAGEPVARESLGSPQDQTLGPSNI